jgi:two-component system, LytTR family, response regulator
VLRAIVVDDERLARVELRALLAAESGVAVVGEASSVDEAAALVARERPDVVFLDIQLGAESGFDLLERVEASFDLVFVTAYDQHAVRAFEINAVDYLLKPVDPARLAATVRRVAHPETARDAAPSAATPFDAEDRLFVRTMHRWRFLAVGEIVVIEAAGDFTNVRTSRGEEILLARSMREWESRLPVRTFTRIHRGTIVNLSCVERVDEGDGTAFRVHVRGIPAPYAMSRRYAARLRS